MVELIPKTEPGRGQGTPASVAGVGAASFDVRGWKAVALQVTSSNWGTQLEVEFKWSLDRSAWHSFPSSLVATDDAVFQNVDVEGLPYLALDVTTADTGASGPTVRIWGQA